MHFCQLLLHLVLDLNGYLPSAMLDRWHIGVSCDVIFPRLVTHGVK